MLVITICITGPTNTSFVQPLLFSSEIVCNMTSGILRAEQNLGRPGEQRGHLPNYSKARWSYVVALIVFCPYAAAQCLLRGI